MLRAIYAIACLASATRAELKHNQSRKDSWDNIRQYTTRGDLSEIDLANLMRVLDLILNSAEFQPLEISIATLESDFDLSGKLSRVFENKLIVSYQVKLRNDLNSVPLAHRIGLTWIILVKDRYSFQYYASWSRSFWNPKNKYIIFFLDACYSNCNNWKQIFSNLWRRHRVSKILIGSIDEHFQYLYSYLPFEIGSGEYGSTRKIFIDQENIEIFLRNHKAGFSYFRNNGQSESFGKDEALPLKKVQTLFENFSNLNRYIINVTVIVGIISIKTDFKIRKLIEEVLNADFRLTTISKDQKYDPFETGLNRLDSGEAELILSAYFIKPYVGQHLFDFTVGFYIDKVCLISRSAGRVPKSFMPFLPISLDFWPLLIVYNIGISVLWISFKNLSNKIHRKLPSGRFKQKKSQEDWETDSPEINYWVIACVDITVSACSSLKGAKTSAERLFITGTLCFTVLVLSLYRSTLISSLSKLFRYRELHTLEDVAASNMPIWTKYKNLKSNTFYDPNLRKKIVVVEDKNLTIRQLVARSNNILGLVRLSTLELENNLEFHDEDGENMLHLVEECPDQYTLSLVTRRLSPYTDRIDSLLLRINQAGLFWKWYDDVRYPIFKAQKRKYARISMKSKLTLAHYSLMFCGLLGILLCCTVVFIAEILYVRAARIRKNKEN